MIRAKFNAAKLNVVNLKSTVNVKAYSKLNRPGPIPLPKKEQEEFERLQKQAAEKAKSSPMHPAASERYEEFEGNVNPVTGEVGGPKQDPLRHGDYSFNGRVTDF